MANVDNSGFVCGKCGASLLGDEPLGRHCLACLLDPAFDQREEPGADAGPFDHYRLVTRADGMPVELGRGAMGSLTKRSILIFATP
jgi:hypothetical protein